MGVQGLWELLAPVGRRVSVEAIANKIVAVDASIWLVQFIKAMRDDRGDMIRNAHLIGFFRRICKLLFLRIKPVFVFDGATPTLKKRTTLARKRIRDNAHASIKKTAEKLLLNHLRAVKLEQIATQLKSQHKSTKLTSNTASESQQPGTADRGCDVINGLQTARDSQVATDAMLAASLAAEENGEEEDVAWLQDVSNVAGPSHATETEDRFEAEKEMNSSLNLDPAMLASLPNSAQLQLMVQMREQLAAENREKFQALAKAPNQFSVLQVEAYLKTVAMRRDINAVQQAAAANWKAEDGAPSTRIASQTDREFIFTKGSAASDIHIKREPCDEAVPQSQVLSEKENEVEELGQSQSSSYRFLPHINLPSVLADAFEHSRNQKQSSRDAAERSTLLSSVPVADTDPASPPASNAQCKASQESVVQTYVDDAGRTRVSRVRGMGVRMTRDLQWNLYLMKDREKVKEKAVEICLELGNGVEQDEDEHMDLFLRLAKGAGEKGVGKEDGNLAEAATAVDGLSGDADGCEDDGVEWEDGECDGGMQEEAVDMADNSNNDLHSYGVPEGPQMDDAADAGPSFQVSESLLADKITVPDSATVENGSTVSKDATDQDLERQQLDGLTVAETVAGRLEGAVLAVQLSVEEEEPAAMADNSKDLPSSPVPQLEIPAQRIAGLSAPDSPSVHDITMDTVPVSLHQNDDDECQVVGVTPPLTAGSGLPIPPEGSHDVDREIAELARVDLELEAEKAKLAMEHDALQAELAEQEEYMEDVAGVEQRLAEDVAGVEQRLAEEWQSVREEGSRLHSEQRRHERNAESVTSEMFQQCQELLTMFGIPYIVAPTEAEAQCAFLNDSGQVDGIVTDDCDVFLFGGRTVFRNLFDDRKYVETYYMKDVEAELGLTRDRLISMALLLGSDYTQGISGIGIVNAIEVVNAFPGEDGLLKFKDWLDAPDEKLLEQVEQEMAGKKKGKKRQETGAAADSQGGAIGELQRSFQEKHRGVSKNWKIVEPFPSQLVVDAYLNPNVDRSTDRFTWGRPDLEALRELCVDKLGFTVAKADEQLIPVLKACSSRETQLRMDSFYTFNQRFAKIRSKRIQKALQGITGGINPNFLYEDDAATDADKLGSQDFDVTVVSEDEMPISMLAKAKDRKVKQQSKKRPRGKIIAAVVGSEQGSQKQRTVHEGEGICSAVPECVSTDEVEGSHGGKIMSLNEGVCFERGSCLPHIESDSVLVSAGVSEGVKSGGFMDPGADNGSDMGKLRAAPFRRKRK